MTVLCCVAAALVATASTPGAAAPRPRETEVIDGRSEYRRQTLTTATLVEKKGRLSALKAFRFAKSVSQQIDKKKKIHGKIKGKVNCMSKLMTLLER